MPMLRGVPINKGDKVTLHAEVVSPDVVSVLVHVPGCVHVCNVLVSAIATHTPAPRPLAVGDRAKHRCGGWFGEIIAVHEHLAWVKSTFLGTYPLDDFERVDA